jgi:hypothetical protein
MKNTRFHSKSQRTVTKMKDDIQTDITIAGSVGKPCSDFVPPSFSGDCPQDLDFYRHISWSFLWSLIWDESMCSLCWYWWNCWPKMKDDIQTDITIAGSVGKPCSDFVPPSQVSKPMNVTLFLDRWRSKSECIVVLFWSQCVIFNYHCVFSWFGLVCFWC